MLLLVISAVSPVLSVYVGGSAVLHLAGTGAALAFLVGGIGAACLALLYAELGSRHPGAGGVYPGLAARLGPGVAHGYVFMTMLVAFPLIAISATGLAGYLRVLWPAAVGAWLAPLAIFAAAGIAMLHIRTGALVTGLFLAVELAALAVLAWAGLAHPVQPLAAVLLHPATATGAPVPPLDLVLAGFAGLFWTGGAVYALYFVEEMFGGAAQLPRVVVRAGVLSALLIAGPMLALVPAMDDLPALLASETPIAAFLAARVSPWLARAVSLGVVVAVFNALVATIIAYARMVHAVGRDGALPRPLARLAAQVGRRFHAPWGAALMIATVSAAMTGLSERWLLILTSSNIADYLLVGLALLAARRAKDSAKDGACFAVPLHPLLPVVAILLTCGAALAFWLDADVGRPSLAILAAVFVMAWAGWHWRRRRGTLLTMTGTPR